MPPDSVKPSNCWIMANRLLSRHRRPNLTSRDVAAIDKRNPKTKRHRRNRLGHFLFASTVPTRSVDFVTYFETVANALRRKRKNFLRLMLTRRQKLAHPAPLADNSKNPPKRIATRNNPFDAWTILHSRMPSMSRTIRLSQSPSRMAQHA